MPPLTLEPSPDGVFLETEFDVVNNEIYHRLKNDNKKAQEPCVWRYHHYNSYAPYAQKRAAISSALKKIVVHASDERNIICGGIRKLKEFVMLSYPFSVLKYCANVAASQGHARAWNVVLKNLRTHFSSR